MSINPLKRIVNFLALVLLARCLCAGLGFCAYRHAGFGSGVSVGDLSIETLLAARWGMGFVGTAAATFMVMKTARIRSTQSATGILYIAMIFVIFGELTSIIMAARSGVVW
jgi:hypothetical protein